MLSSGAILSERYRLEDRIAIGGMGEVWRATDVVLGREVAVKILLPSLLADPSFIARFNGEARMMATLRHPGIVQVFDYGEDTLADGGRANYLVMEFVNGEPLSKRIDAAGRLGVPETLGIVEKAARALHGAHGAGIVHRDVKPSNLLVQPNGNVVLVDFGVARSSNITSVTSTNAVPGTVLYMAPEQATGKPVSAATDIYALGAVAYCCLAGHPPFHGENPLEVAVKHLHEDPPPLPDEVPPPVRDLIARALAKDPAERYPDAAAFATAARKARTAPATAATTALVGAAAPVAAGGAAVRKAVARDSNTLSEMPVTPQRSGRSRGPAATVAGVILAALLGLGALAAVLGFGRDHDRPETNSPAPTGSATAPAAPQESAPGDDDAPTYRESGPTRHATERTGQPSVTPTAPSQEPSQTPSRTPSKSATPSQTTSSDAPPTEPPASPGGERQDAGGTRR
ncbi:protein kinase [Micromonospora sp. NPDC049559]|uniref:serine/threonine-protein kinase n=1 Tax=Micromonospora sp. NPDC049559 TaxID=3155923 RepID=UPI003418C230